jgi:hypothetical protein
MNTLTQIGGGLLILGIVVKLAIMLAFTLGPLAGWAIGIGAILLIIGLVSPRR